MDIEIRKIQIPSSDGIHNLAGIAYIPQTTIKGIFHIVHGMTEQMGRYHRIMTDLSNEGYLCVGFDCLGHGYTVNDKSELGYFADKKGWELLVRDVKLFADAIKAEYGEGLPYYLMGHSMGSFIARLACERCIEPDKLILMGTSGPNRAVNIGLALITLNKLVYGGHHFSKTIDKLVFGDYKKGREKKSQNGTWLTTDPEGRKKYWINDFGSFKFSVGAMGDLMRLMKYSNREAWFEKISADIPILIISGDEDPVGCHGKGVQQLSDILKKKGKNVKCILYKGARHEILNDFSYDKVLSDIKYFIL